MCSCRLSGKRSYFVLKFAYLQSELFLSFVRNSYRLSIIKKNYSPAHRVALELNDMSMSEKRLHFRIDRLRWCSRAGRKNYIKG